MSQAWIYFTIVIFIQILLFVIHAYYEKKLPNALRILGKGVLSGIILGLLFDIIFGKFFGLFSYALGFGVLFITLNAALFWGLFVAHVLLMQQARLHHFYIWTMIVGAVTEIVNLSMPLWNWKFVSLPLIEYVIVLSAGYFGIAILIAVVWHIFLGRRFVFIDNLFKK